MSTSTAPFHANTFRAMWRTRPVRIPTNQGGDGKLGGVCEGMGVRYDIDPVILRVMFIVSTLVGAGAGMALYLLSWALMPRYGLSISPAEALLKKTQDPRASRERKLAVVLLLGFVLFAAPISTGSFSLLVPYLLFFAAWYALHIRKPHPPNNLLTTNVTFPEESPVTTAPESPATSQSAASVDAPHTAQTPPAWDPLGVAPFAWDLPEPTPYGESSAPKKKTARTVLIAVAVGLFVVPAAVMTGLSVLFSFIDEGASSVNGLGDVNIAVTNGSQLETDYKTGLGNFTLDLSNLAPLEQDTTVNIEGGLGNTTIYVPNNIPTQLHCSGGAGNMDCSANTIAPKNANDKTLTLNIQGDLGDIETVNKKN